MSERLLFNALLKSDLTSFLYKSFPVIVGGEQLQPNWHHRAICYQLERVLTGEVTRLIIEVPPRSLKSLLTSVAFPAFCLGRDPTRKIITASYSSDLAIKFSNDCRALMRSHFYRSLFPGTIIGTGKDTESEFQTSKGGYRFSTSTGGTLTGRGGDMLILDDIMNPRDAASDAKRESVISWYANTAFSRLNDKRTAAIIVVMQRLHVDDLAGHLRGQGGWEIVSLPAIAEEDQDIPLAGNRTYHRQRGSLLHPQREPQSVLDELRRTIGSYNFSAQYQQEPIPVEGELIKVRWFSSYSDLPSRSDATVVQSWDVGMKGGVGNDYSVCTTWLNDGRNHYLLDVLRGQWEFPELLRQLERAQRHYQADSVLIEDKVTGTPLIQHLKANRPFGFPSPIGINPEGDKVTRIIGESPAIEAGQVFLPELADWLPAFKNEVRQFPNGKHDDQIDSMSQYLKWARRRSGPDFRAMRICGR